MFVVKDKWGGKEFFVQNEQELWDWWTFSYVDEISWKDLVNSIYNDEIVKLSWHFVSKYKPKEPEPKVNPMCKHPNKYKNVISKTMVFWVCPDCKKDLGDG